MDFFIRAGAAKASAASSFTVDAAGYAMVEWRVLSLPDQSQAFFLRRREGGADLYSLTESELTQALRRWPDVVNDGLVVSGKGSEWQVSLAPTASFDLFATVDEKGDLLLASTVARLLGDAVPCAAPDLDALAERFVGALTIDSADTVARGIKRIIGGNEVRAVAGQLTINRWWEPRNFTVRRNFTSKQAAADLRRLAEAVVRRNLPADGSVGVHLSGGRDSSVLCALAALQLAADGRTVHAFTSVPCANLPDGDEHYQYDEGANAAGTAARYSNVKHHLFCPEPLPLSTILDELHQRIGEPINQPVSLEWIWPQLARCSDLGLPSLLTGDSGNFTISAGGLLSLADVWREEGFLKWVRASAKAMQRAALRCVTFFERVSAARFRRCCTRQGASAVGRQSLLTISCFSKGYARQVANAFSPE